MEQAEISGILGSEEKSMNESIAQYGPFSFNEYQQLAERTAGRKDQRERFGNFGLGISGEAGEVTDIIKKHLFHGHELDKDKLCKELGDTLWYIATIATTAGITLEEVARGNIEKLMNRYPEGFDKERSINREMEKGE